MNIFISYSSKDFDIASSACDVMEENGFPCFIAPRNIRSGHIYAEEIIFGLKNSDVLLLILTENSNASAHVMREVEWSVSNNVPILAYRLEDVKLTPSMEYFLMSTQWLDGTVDKNFEELLDSLYGLEEDLAEQIALRTRKGEEAVRELERFEQEDSDGNYYEDEEEVYPEEEYIEDIEDIEEVEEDEDEIIAEQQSPQLKQPKQKKNRKKVWIWIAAGIAAVGVLFLVAIVGTFIIVNVAVSQDKKGNANQASSERGKEKESMTTEGEGPMFITSSEEESAGGHKNDSFVLGSSVVLGVYYKEPIEWRVIHINGDGTVDMITDQIICCKAFDGAESGTAYIDNSGEMVDELSASRPRLAQAYGNTSWVTSNLRIWLNSLDTNVSYMDQPPTNQSVSENKNGYDTEAGFLFGFEEDERDAIVCTGREMDYYDPESDAMLHNTVYDNVRLLCADELDLLARANVDTFVLPTETAMKTDHSSYYRDYCWDMGIDTLEWWLMFPLSNDSHKMGVVSTGVQGHDKLEERNAFSEGLGVRPVITVDPKLVPQ